jgi:hypothetical protein
MVLEQMKELGGTWVYTPVSPSENQPHSSLYKNLRYVEQEFNVYPNSKMVHAT